MPPHGNIVHTNEMGDMNLGTSCRAINKDIVMDDEPKSLVNQEGRPKSNAVANIHTDFPNVSHKHFVNINLK